MSTNTDPRRDETDSNLALYVIAVALVLINVALSLIFL